MPDAELVIENVMENPVHKAPAFRVQGRNSPVWNVPILAPAQGKGLLEPEPIVDQLGVVAVKQQPASQRLRPLVMGPLRGHDAVAMKIPDE